MVRKYIPAEMTVAKEILNFSKISNQQIVINESCSTKQ